jgi:hypothetical protein
LPSFGKSTVEVVVVGSYYLVVGGANCNVDPLKERTICNKGHVIDQELVVKHEDVKD